jgi:hypothetical protein
MSAPAAAAGTHKDELTGEMVSKRSVLYLSPIGQLTGGHSELKRRIQQRQKADAKASKAPAPAAGAAKAKVVSAADQEAELNPNVSVVRSNVESRAHEQTAIPRASLPHYQGSA